MPFTLRSTKIDCALTCLKAMDLDFKVEHVKGGYIVTPVKACHLSKTDMVVNGSYGGPYLGGAGASLDKAFADMGKRLMQAHQDKEVILVVDQALQGQEGEVKVYQFDQNGLPKLTHTTDANRHYLPVSQIACASSSAELESQIRGLFGMGVGSSGPV